MIASTEYLWFETKTRQEFVRITDEVAAIVRRSGVKEGMVLASAMHITAGVYVNDWEDGLIHDFQVWLDKLAPSGLDYRHHQTGEDNADAHLKRTIMGHQVIVPVTAGKLDLGPWEQVFYAEFDGQRRKRVVVKAMGESPVTSVRCSGFWVPRSCSSFAFAVLSARFGVRRSRPAPNPEHRTANLALRTGTWNTNLEPGTRNAERRRRGSIPIARSSAWVR